MFCKSHINDSENTVCKRCLTTLPYAKNSGCFEAIGADYLISPLLYKGNAARAIRDLKFKSKFENADVFASLICGYLFENKQAMAADIIVNVPLSPKSLARRGFNQTTLIADKISKKLNIAFDENALIKTRETKRQSSLKTFNERARNVYNVYECTVDMHGKTVLLVDDIYTSGMTVYDCTRTLKEKGASAVIAVTVANAHKDAGFSTHDYVASRLVFNTKNK